MTHPHKSTAFRVVAVLTLVAVIAVACTNNPAAPADSVQRTRAAGFELPAEGFVSVSGGPDQGCGVRVGGSLQCWARSGFGQPGPALAGEYTEVGFSRRGVMCGLRADASMTCPKRGLYPDTDADVQWPPEGDVAALSTGFAECALRPDRTLVCERTGWGEDDVATPGGEFEAVSVGNNFACGIRPDRALECWGSNLVRIDPSGTVGGYVDVGVARPPEGEFVAVYAGYRHACAIEASGGMRCWGSNDFNEWSPVPPGEFVAVAVGSVTSCGLRANGDLACWGSDADHDMPGGKFVAISEGLYGFCGLRPDGNVDCWTVGDSWRECLWEVMSFSPFHQPFGMDVCTHSMWQLPSHSGVRVLAPAGAYQALSARKGHTCALRLDGAARCWGQVAHRAPKRAVPRLLARGLIVAVFPAGQVTVRAVVSMAKSPRR